MARKTLTPQQFGTYDAVSQVRLNAVTADGGCVTPAYTDIVEHGGFFQELTVEPEFGVSIAEHETTVGDLSRMFQQQFFQVIIFRIIFVYY
jgi:hypothetical protein